MSERPLELDDIQGNILAGFNTNVQVFHALTVVSADAFPEACRWLAEQAGAITTVAEVRAARGSMKQGLSEAAPTWLFLAVGSRVLSRTQPDLRIRDDAFNGGMENRAPGVLGDKTDPAHWAVGGTSNPVDVLLVLASNNEAAAVARGELLVASAGKVGLRLSYREVGRRLPGEIEHFGFRDGLSQPSIAGFEAGGEHGAGNFVFGYQRSKGEAPYAPSPDERQIADNGSLLVLRRLRQDVAAFQRFCAAEAQRLSARWPGVRPGHLAALLVGRWPSGAPATTRDADDPGASPADNQFHFDTDPDGAACPFGAHIRKVNPRKGPRDKVNVPRLLRRGIPFGRPAAQDPAGERGLLFVAFQTSIKEQFEFLSEHWMNSDDRPASTTHGHAHDLLVGSNDGAKSMTIAGPQGAVEVSRAEQEWIVPTGGAYLFAPGRRGLAKFSKPASKLGLWRVKKVWAIALDTVKPGRR